MSEQESIWLLTDQPATASAVEGALNGHAGPAGLRLCDDVADLQRHLETKPRTLVLVDLDPSPSARLASLEPVVSRFDQARFVVLAEQCDQRLLLEAMQIGARHFLLKASLRSDLQSVVRRLAPNGAGRPGRGGSVLTVLSAGGGCGATTLAVNLANELQLLASTPALLIDLDAAYGAISLYLGLTGQYGLADVLAHSGHVDAELIRSTALHFSENLHVLLSPASISMAEPAPLTLNRLPEAVRACTHVYPWTVVDAPRVPIAVAADLVGVSACTFIAFQLSVKDVRIARATHDALLRHGVSSQSLRFVACRFHKHRSMIRLSDAQRALGNDDVLLVSNDYHSAVTSMNFGHLLAESAPRSAQRRDIAAIAKTLAAEVAAGSSASAGGAQS